MSEITFRDVHKRYPGASLDTIRKVDLEIKHGEFVVFVGPSGCGKSTLLRMVAGLEDISSGELKIKGKRVNEVPPSRRGVAMVFQSYALYPHMTVYDNMAFGLKQAKTDSSTIDQRVRKASKILQLDPLLERLPKALSGGQRQRVAIGRAIVREPDVFLFDEPLSNLDASLRVQTRLELAKLNSDIGTASMIYVTHDQVEAMTLADKIVLLNAGEPVQRDGSVAQFGEPLELYHHPVNKFVAGFIGSPKMNFVGGKLLRSEGKTSIARIGEAEFRAEVDSSRVAANSDITLGVRPEHVQFVDAGTANSITGLVAFIELLGESSYVYVRLASGELFTVRETGQSHHVVGNAVNVYFPPQCIHMFDSNERACRRTTDSAMLGQPHLPAATAPVQNAA